MGGLFDFRVSSLALAKSLTITLISLKVYNLDLCDPALKFFLDHPTKLHLNILIDKAKPILQTFDYGQPFYAGKSR